MQSTPYEGEKVALPKDQTEMEDRESLASNVILSWDLLNRFRSTLPTRCVSRMLVIEKR